MISINKKKGAYYLLQFRALALALARARALARIFLNAVIQYNQ